MLPAICPPRTAGATANLLSALLCYAPCARQGFCSPSPLRSIMIVPGAAGPIRSGRVQRTKPLLPPGEPSLPLVRRPCLAVAVGRRGETVLAQAPSPAGPRPFVALTSWQIAASWRKAVELVLHHRG